jgi:hypothetical protein
MTRRVVSLLFLLPVALALFTAQFAQAQRGGHGGISAGHIGGGGLARGSGAFSPSFSRSPQSFRSPSMTFGQARPYMNSPYSAYNRQPYSSYGNGGYRNGGYRNRVGYPFPFNPFGYAPYGGFLPDVLDYPSSSLFDDDGNGYGSDPAPETASQAPYPPDPESYGPPPPQGAYAGNYGPAGPYPGPNDPPSAGYRPAYQNSGALDPLPAQPPTTLVFQDGRPTEQVHNYVLTKTTLYDLDANSHRDIPLADLNLPATIAANRSAGIDFSLPAGY